MFSVLISLPVRPIYGTLLGSFGANLSFIFLELVIARASGAITSSQKESPVHRRIRMARKKSTRTTTRNNKQKAPASKETARGAVEKEEPITTAVEEKQDVATETKADTAATVTTTTETKVASKTKPATANTPSPVEIENYFEIDGGQVKVEDVIASIYEAYKAAGHRIGYIKKLQTYYNFEERRCYYVVNDKAEGLFVEF